MVHKGKAIVIGSFADAAHTTWGQGAEAFESAVEVLEYLHADQHILDDLAYRLDLPHGDVVEHIKEVDENKALDALVDILQATPNIAVKVCRNLREAELFVNMVEQMDEKRRKEQTRHRAVL